MCLKNKLNLYLVTLAVFGSMAPGGLLATDVTQMLKAARKPRASGRSIAGASELRGELIIEPAISGSMPQFTIVFEGKSYMSNREGFYTIPLGDHPSLTQFQILICKNYTHTFDRNTSQDLAIIPDKEYRYFVFQRAGNGLSSEWHHTEKQLDSSGFAIPPATVIFFIDPNLVVRLEPCNFDAQGQSVLLPVIVLKNDTNPKRSVARASAKSLLYTLDRGLFHEPVKEECQNHSSDPKAYISLTRSW